MLVTITGSTELRFLLQNIPSFRHLGQQVHCSGYIIRKGEQCSVSGGKPYLLIERILQFKEYRALGAEDIEDVHFYLEHPVKYRE